MRTTDLEIFYENVSSLNHLHSLNHVKIRSLAKQLGTIRQKMMIL